DRRSPGWSRDRLLWLCRLAHTRRRFPALQFLPLEPALYCADASGGGAWLRRAIHADCEARRHRGPVRRCRTRSLHQLSRFHADRGRAVLRFRVRLVRTAFARTSLADRAPRLGLHAAMVEVVARSLPLWPIRMGMAQLVALAVGAVAPLTHLPIVLRNLQQPAESVETAPRGPSARPLPGVRLGVVGDAPIRGLQHGNSVGPVAGGEADRILAEPLHLFGQHLRFHR